MKDMIRSGKAIPLMKTECVVFEIKALGVILINMCGIVTRRAGTFGISRGDHTRLAHLRSLPRALGRSRSRPSVRPFTTMGTTRKKVSP